MIACHLVVFPNGILFHSHLCLVYKINYIVHLLVMDTIISHARSIYLQFITIFI